VLDELTSSPANGYNGDVARGTAKETLRKTCSAFLMTERDGATITPSKSIPGQKDAQVSIIEGKTGMVMLGAGVSK